MANKKLWLGMLAVALVFGMTVVGCDSGSTGIKSTTDITPDTNSGVYQGANVLGNKYVLKITENTGRAVKAALGDSYELTITFKDRTKITSTGTIKEVTADGTFKLEPSVEGSKPFSLVINNNQISSVTGEIVLAEGKIFTLPTFGIIYLKVERWGDRDTERRWGEQWSSGFCINLLDFIEGNIKPDGKYNMTLSGTTDTTLEHTLIDIWGVPSGNISGWDPSNAWMGTDINALNNQHVKIPKGIFRETYLVQFIENHGLDYQENRYIMLDFMDRKLIVDLDLGTNQDFGGIPADIDNGTRMAKIENFSISMTEAD